MAEKAILTTLSKQKVVKDSFAFAKENGFDHQTVVGTIKSLEADEFVKSETLSLDVVTLTDEGSMYAKEGSPEGTVFKLVQQKGDEGLPMPELNKTLGNMAKIGMSQAMSAKWIRVDKSKGAPRLFTAVASIEDVVQKTLQTIDKDGADRIEKPILDQLRKRKLIQSSVLRYYKVEKGPKFALERKKATADLTTDMLASGAWKTAEFKKYNLDALGIPPDAGHLHPLMKVRTEYREIFLEMGFEEMPTNNFVESSFWNFDTLFQPQAHPARDMHDTFFLSEPKECHTLPDDLLKRVQQMHEKGGHGSIGHGYDWKIDEARKNLLRTHTTAVSSRMLRRLAENGFRPTKYFSIDRVFRNEALDATHLAEFHQIEGVVADYNLRLSDLMGLIYQFFSYIGITELRFKPTYNPYTEPSMEIFSYHPGLKKWVEIGNSGMFRPEMLLPLGLPEDVRVAAWGLSLERPTMIKYGISNIRDLIGHKIDLGMIANNPLCRLDA